MHVILVGCGRVGASVATALAADEHDVVVIDRNPGAFDQLGSAFNGMTVAGTGIDIEILRRAGIERADAFVAVTSQDNVNLMASQIAKQIFRVPKVIARVNDPRKNSVYDEFEVETISPTDLGASRLQRMIDARGIQTVSSWGAGEVVAVRLTVAGPLVGQTVSDLELPGKVRVSCLERGGVAQIPEGDVTLERGDLLFLAVRRDALHLLEGASREERRS